MNVDRFVLRQQSLAPAIFFHVSLCTSDLPSNLSRATPVHKALTPTSNFTATTTPRFLPRRGCCHPRLQSLRLAPGVLPARGGTRSCRDQGRSGGGRSRSVQGSAMAGAWLSCVFEGELEEMKREKHGV